MLRRRRQRDAWRRIRAAEQNLARQKAEAVRQRAEQEAKAAMEDRTVRQPIRRALERNHFSSMIEDAFRGRA